MPRLSLPEIPHSGNLYAIQDQVIYTVRDKDYRLAATNSKFDVVSESPLVFFPKYVICVQS